MPVPALRYEEPSFRDGLAKYVALTCRRYRVRAVDVDDLVQETLTNVVASIGSFRPENGEFDQWAKGVALNVIRRYKRDAKRYFDRFSECYPNVDDYATHEPSPERCTQKRQAQDALSIAMETLTARQANIVHFFVIHDMSHADIGNELGISPAASHKCLERALNHLACCVRTDLLSALPPSVSSCDESLSLNKKDSRWYERSHYVVQLATMITAVLLLSSIHSSTVRSEVVTSEMRVLDDAQNAVMGYSDKHSDVHDEPEVHRDAPSVKPEPASLTSVRAVPTAKSVVDKPSTLPQYVPHFSYKHTPRSEDHRPFGR